MLLACSLLLAALAVGALFLSPVQTWIVHSALARYPDLPITVESVSADLATVRLSNLRVRAGSVTLAAPSLEARVSLLAAWRQHRLPIQALTAKGWRLDLGAPGPSREEASAPVAITPAPTVAPGPIPEAAEGATASWAAALVHRLLPEGKEPFEWSLAGVDLEGEIVRHSPAARDDLRLALGLQGSGLARGQTGEFTLAARVPPADARRSEGVLATRGRLAVKIDSALQVERLSYTGSLSTGEARLPAALELRAEANLLAGTEAERYSLQVRHGERMLLNVATRFRSESQDFAGHWQLHLTETDFIQPLGRDSLIAYSLEGAGDFDAPSSLSRAHVTGQAVISGCRWPGLPPVLNRLSAGTASGTFEVAVEREFTRFERFEVTLSGERPLLRLEALQPFQFDRKGELSPTTPSIDWLAGHLTELPLAFLSTTQDKWTLTGGGLSGDLLVQWGAGGLKVASRAPLSAKGVSIGSADRPLVKGLDLTLTLVAEHTAQGWQFQASPLVFSAGGDAVMTIQAKHSPLERTGRNLVTTGKWQADLEKLAPLCARGDLLVGKSASGDFAVSSGARSDWRTTVNVIGRAAGQALTASVRATVDPYGYSVELPLTVTEGGKKSELFVHVGGAVGKSGFSSEVDVKGVDVTLAHVEPFLEPFARAGGMGWSDLIKAGRRELRPEGPADLQPFWGEWTGRGKIELYRLDLGEYELFDLATAFTVGPETLQFEQGKAILEKKVPPAPNPTRGRPPSSLPRVPAQRMNWSVDGRVDFAAKEPLPYSLVASVTVGPVDSTRWFPAKSSGGPQPFLEGKLKVRDTISARGRNLTELLVRRQDEFRAVSAGGIIRLLETNVAQSLPDAPTPMKDALAGVGSAVAALFGVNTRTMQVGMNKLSQPMEAVLNLTYEFPLVRYDYLAATAVSEPEGDLRLTDIELVAANVKLSGGGRISRDAGLPFSARPLTLDLQLSARERMGSLLATAGLLSPTKDDRGFAPLNQSLRFGGSLEAVDNSEWHDLLVKAASQPNPKGR